MEPEGPLLYLQEPIPGPSTEFICSTADHHTLSLYDRFYHTIYIKLFRVQESVKAITLDCQISP